MLYKFTMYGGGASSYNDLIKEPGIGNSPNRDKLNCSDFDNLSSTKTRFNTINDEHYIIGPTVILDLLLKHLLLRYPIMLPILQKFNCYHIAMATVSDQL